MELEQIERFYSMGEVVRETGVPAATLRAWERRYGVPRPQRSSGRHRLYSGHEVAMVKWLIARQQEGMGISRAIAVWRQLAARVQEPAGQPGLPPAAARAADHSLQGLREAWLGACQRFDRRAAEATLSEAFALQSQEEVCLRLLKQGLSELGDRWDRGEASVQQEHFASALATHHLERLLAAAPSPWRSARILLACPPEEQHSFGLLLLALLLRRRGWDTLYLGANVPIGQLDETVAATRPSLAILAAYRLTTAATLIEMARVLRDLGVEVAYGGLVFNRAPALRARVVGHFLGDDLALVPDSVGRLMDVSASGPGEQG